MKQYDHLFFDLDHTLWDFEKNAKAALSKVYTLTLHDRPEISFDAFFEKYLVHNAQLWARYENGFIGVEELKWKRMWRTLLDFKIADEPLAKSLSNQFLELLPLQKEVFPYCFEILDYLTAKKYKLHLITNGFEVTQRKKLNNAGLTHYFTEIITSEISNSLKPNKEIFEFAIARAGTSAEKCLMIGDNQQADIRGALNAGLDAVFVNHVDATVTVQPTYMITHLKELETLL